MFRIGNKSGNNRAQIRLLVTNRKLGKSIKAHNLAIDGAKAG
jgi:hypothetical protein